jgi:tetratricopeptide (TPR) repeat protein
MHYKRPEKSLPEIARELNVDHVVEGSVLRAGDRVRISVQLIDAPGDRHLWANSYERDLKDVLTLQSEVAQDIAGQVRAQLTPQERTRLSNKRPVNPKAYEAVLKGFHHTLHWEMSEIEKGRRYFEQAIAEDPNYALAHAGLAETYILQGYQEGISPGEIIPKAKPALAEALRLDKNLAHAHRQLGFFHGIYEHNWPEAERDYKRALELEPGRGWSHYAYAAFYLSPLGRHSEALAEIEQARQLEPLSANINNSVGIIHMRRREYGIAADQFRKTLELAPDFTTARANLAVCYGLQGRFDEALAELRLIDSPATTAWVYATAGKTAEARKLLNQLERESRIRYIPGVDFALIYSALGERDLAMSSLERAYEEHEPRMAWLKVGPRFDPLRSDPRFQALLEKIGLNR